MPVQREEIFTSDSYCYACKCIISEPYVRCAICNYVTLCTSCFAKGKEKLGHESDHDYMIIHNDFSLLVDSGWTAREVKSLLDSLREYGFGNWSSISNSVLSKSAKECKRYYLQYFVDNPSIPGLPTFGPSATSFYGCEPIPFMHKLENIEDPPRFAPGTMNHKLMGGYNAVRSDFDINFDNHAELKISTLNYTSFISETKTNTDNSSLGQSLQIALFQAYNTRLKERGHRHKIIRNHGLISTRKSMYCLLRYDHTITRALAERMRKFSQVSSGIEFDTIMECLHQIGELKNHLSQLFAYRQNGLKCFHSIPLFNELFQLQQKYCRDKKQYVTNADCHWQKIVSVISNNNGPSLTNLRKRKTAPPLSIHPGMKEYDKLDKNERDLCSIVRILPEMYMEIKHLLISENKKYGSVKLAQARQLLKIDVNKTKKIHEFLAKQNHIITT